MHTRKNGGGMNPDALQKGWLNLSLGPYLGSKSRCNTSMKVYTCSFCKRKFYSSQALGGHQNAHRRERDEARRCNFPEMMNFTVNKSLDVHSLVCPPGRGGETSVAMSMFMDSGVSWVPPYVAEEAVDLKWPWPGSFYTNLQPASMQSDPHMLDLNLKL